MTKRLALLSSALALVMLTGCANKTTVATPECSTVKECAELAKKRKEELTQKEQLLTQKEQKLKELEEQLKRAEQEAQNCQKTQNTIKLPESGLTLLPPDAKPGMCYGRVIVPPVYKTEKVKVLIDEGGEKVITIPPKYTWVEEKVLVREAGEKIIPTPPVYKTVTEKILVKPETEKIVVVRPAKYKWVTKKVLVEPEHTVWKRGSALYEGENNNILSQKFNPSTGEIMCLVKVPAKYKTIRQKVMVEPPVTKKVKVPAVYKTITKKVLIKPAGTKVVKIPPVYKTIKVKKLVEPAKVVTKKIPPKYAYVTKRVKVRDIEYKWEPVVCKTNMTPGLIKDLQRKLKKLGYYKGPIDGIYGPMTQRAVNAYQKDHGLAQGALTLQTCKALDI